MEPLDDYKARLLLVCLVTVMFLGSGRTNADFTFGTPTNLGATVNSLYVEHRLSIPADGLSLYFSEYYDYEPRPGGLGGLDIWVTTRKTRSNLWGPPVNVGPPVNSSADELLPWIFDDGLSLYFCSDRQGGYGGWDIWVATRTTESDPWSTPVNLGPKINTANHEADVCISSDGLELYFPAYNRPGGYGGFDIWLATKATKDDAWSEPVNLGPIINTSTTDGSPCLSPDGLTLFFKSRWPHGDQDLYVTRRAVKSDSWGPPVNLGPKVNTRFEDTFPCLSSDGLTLFLSSNRPGGYGSFDLWQVPIIPILDFNGDGIVDSADMCIIIDYWGENYPLCDIGPMPWGDRVVDVEDLKVLAEHLFEEINDPTLVAHWPLDEAAGIIDTDSVSETGYGDGIVVGDPLWQPVGGQIDGAIQLDGVDDFIITNPVLNPANGPFSIFVWVNGGAPDQVVVSQQATSNWLATDTDGNLMTELKCTGRSAGYLFSETVITNGQWHHIGLVWDGSHRTLYVDDIVVAEDALHGLVGSQMGLYIGTGKGMEAGTYFSGLIDDVRIYNRVVSP